MSFIESIRTKHEGIALALVAVIGGVLGVSVGARRASACSCIDPNTWSAGLESVTSSDANVDHTAQWPPQGLIYENLQEVTFSGKQTVPGAVRTVAVHK